uniref:Uncharacterized protein n=1 Tax=Calcidiscus leptoporus TaxID=127549 RepID=A0A7S0J2I6_9EUKA
MRVTLAGGRPHAARGRPSCPRYACNPVADAERTDIIQAVRLGDPDKVIALCRAVQRFSPVGSSILPVPGISPGYGDEVIFADGTFIDGSTLELSGDGPLRAPYAAYLQGGTHWTHWKIVLEEAVKAILETDRNNGRS